MRCSLKPPLQRKRKLPLTHQQRIHGTSWEIISFSKDSPEILIRHKDTQETLSVNKRRPVFITGDQGVQLSIVRGCKNHKPFLSITDARATRKKPSRVDRRNPHTGKNRWGKPLGKKSRKR